MEEERESHSQSLVSLTLSLPCKDRAQLLIGFFRLRTLLLREGKGREGGRGGRG